MRNLLDAESDEEIGHPLEVLIHGWHFAVDVGWWLSKRPGVILNRRARLVNILDDRQVSGANRG